MAQGVKDKGRELRFWVILAGYGFALELNCTDYMTMDHEALRIRVLWGKMEPALDWCISEGRYDEQVGRFRFTRVKKGVRTGWEFQGPIRRIG